MKLLDRIDTILFGDTLAEASVNLPATDLLGPPDPSETDAMGQGSSERRVSPQDIVRLANTTYDLDDEYRAGNNPNVPLDFEKRLELALRDAQEGKRWGTTAADDVVKLRSQVELGFAKLNQKLDRLVSGGPEKFNRINTDDPNLGYEAIDDEEDDESGEIHQ